MSLVALEKAERVERAAEDLYRRLAAKFERHRRLSALFAELADEEREHASRVAMLRYQAEGDPQLSARLQLNETHLDRLLEEAELVAAKIVHSKLTREQAIALATRLERVFANAHAESVAAADPWLREFFEALAEDDGRHRAMLDAYLASKDSSISR